ncbi:hypothetical protein WJX72_001188 [[Myrmecia] bisecta]|uniref:Tyrosine specific protein phosphatases domain-containing protein n=1 Tax=[Myrmecia] bisecta TaxID=41462 RepID=A0AAW1Q1Z3_9CHLO
MVDPAAVGQTGRWSLFGRGQQDANYVWQDQEVRFDMATTWLQLRSGEIVIDSMGFVEDTKGNNGEQGELTITNLRVLWVSQRSKRMNLSLGYNAIVSINIRQAASRLRGATQALFVMTKFNGSRFEFIFTNLVKDSPRLFTTIQAVFRAYDTTRLYRDLKLRGALILDKQLKLLPQEQIYNQVHGAWNLSNEQGNLGTFFVTNVRLVWHANLAETFNVSIPYMQIASLRMRESKFGPALVIETSPKSGGYILGFKLEPKERLEEVHKEMVSLWQVYSAKPIFGVEFSVEARPPSLSALTIQRRQDDVEITDSDHPGDTFAAYYAADEEDDQEHGIVYCEELGLAIEALKDALAPLDDKYEDTHAFKYFCNWLLPGHLMLGRYPYVEPSRCKSRSVGEQQLRWLLEGGITTFVCLQDELPPQEQLKIGGEKGFLPYRATATLLASAMSGPPSMAETEGLRNPYVDKFLPSRRTEKPDCRMQQRIELDFMHFPIVDMEIPSKDKLLGLVTELQERLERGERIYVHCWGGRGRAGTVGACLLARAYGIDADEALQRVDRAFSTRNDIGRRSPETDEQVAFIRDFIGSL